MPVKKGMLFVLGGFTKPLRPTWLHHPGREGVQRELAHRENNRFRRMSSTSIVALADHFYGGENTPWKMNGWNLQPSPQITHFGKEHDLNQTSSELCSSR